MQQTDERTRQTAQRIAEQSREAAERKRRVEERIDKLVSAIGQGNVGQYLNNQFKCANQLTPQK